MDKKKKIVLFVLATVGILVGDFRPVVRAQDISQIQLMEKRYEYGTDRDSITLFFNILNSLGERRKDVSTDELLRCFGLNEDGRAVRTNGGRVAVVGNGLRVPSDYTFSVLVDLGISTEGKEKIAELVAYLVESTSDSCVFLSFFGDDVSPTQMVNKNNWSYYKCLFSGTARDKYLYSALYSKLSEFEESEQEILYSSIKKQSGYSRNKLVSERAAVNPGKNILFVFTEGHKRPTIEENLSFLEVSEYQCKKEGVVPIVYAFYYIEDGNDLNIERLLKGICTPNGFPERKGAYMPAEKMDQIVSDFEQVVSERSYDYSFTYRAFEDKVYTGKTLFRVEWTGGLAGEEFFSIGSPERPWPVRKESVGNSTIKYLVAVLVTALVFALFLFIMKVLIPWFRSKIFERKYYKVYVSEQNVRRRRCPYCGCEIEPGQAVVVRCKHIMHVGCWKQNNYRCAEYGQNCKDGIQTHVHWKDLFKKNALRESFQTLSGVVAALAAWLIYELFGRGGFKVLSEWIVAFSLNAEVKERLFSDCVWKTTSFLMIGLLLGFFLSLVFRYNDEYRNKDWKTLLKILGLSLITGLVGMFAFAFGAMLFCLLVAASGASYIPWYASLPAYILFSLAVAATLSWKSSIPMKSALLGGGIASIIGFIVLFSSTGLKEWMNILLDFVIYGGGLGASLVTVRMLSEKYFLVIQNGIRAGQRIPIHKWMNATGGGNKVSIGMTGECEIQMNWEKSNKVAKEHVKLYIDHEKNLPMIKPLATGVQYNNRVELPVGKPCVLSNGDTFKIGDTIFKYDESE